MDAGFSSSSGRRGDARAGVGGMSKGDYSPIYRSEPPVLEIRRETFMERLWNLREDTINEIICRSETASNETVYEGYFCSSNVSNQVSNDQELEKRILRLRRNLKACKLWRYRTNSYMDGGISRESIFDLLSDIREVHVRIATSATVGYSRYIISRLRKCLIRYSEVYPEVSRFFRVCLVNDHLIPLVNADGPRLVQLTEREAREVRLAVTPPYSQRSSDRPVTVSIPSQSVRQPESGASSCLADQPSTSQGTAVYRQRTADASLEDPWEVALSSSFSTEEFMALAGSPKRRLPQPQVPEQVEIHPHATGALSGSEEEIEGSQHEQGQASFEIQTTFSAAQKSSEKRMGTAGQKEEPSFQHHSDTASARTMAVEIVLEHVPPSSSATSEEDVTATGSVPEDVPLQSSSSSEEDVTASGSVKRRLSQTAGQKARKHTYEEQYSTRSATHVDIVGTEHAQQQVTLEGEIPGPSEERKGTTDESVQHMASDDGKDPDVPDSRPRSGMDVASLTEEPEHVSPRQEVQSSAQEETESQSAMDRESQLQPKRTSPE